MTTNNVEPVVSEIPNWASSSPFLQFSHQTAINRFPKVFETMKKIKGNPERILSFGCSTGEECESIAHAFPQAKEIVGVDIDYGSIVTAKSKNKDPRVHFHMDLGATGKYDLVFCMMVLFCIDYPVSMEKFEKTLKNIHEHVNDDGVVVLYSCQYDPTCVKEIKDNYKVLRYWTRVHNRDKKAYHCGYYKKIS